MGLGDGQALVVNCEFIGNQAQQPYFGGGAISCADSSDTQFINCVFLANETLAESGGALLLRGGSTTIANCTFSDNSAPSGDGGGVLVDGGATFYATNCILWGNTHQGSPGEDAQITVQNGSAMVNYTCIEGLTGSLGGVGNIGDDPLFIIPSGNLRLSPGSPCIDAGHNWGMPVDEDDYDGDGNTCELFPVDLDGLPRFRNDLATPDTGCGANAVVDMGAYEFQAPGIPPADIIYADVNGDGIVDVLDLLEVLALWGPTSGCALADLDMDGTVDVLDMLEVLAAWGSC
jgi:hypothetical protein